MRAAAGRSAAASRLCLTGALAALAASALLFLLPATAAAAECTDNWTGPAEGSWTTGSNWSAGVPGEADVACIGTGKTVNMTGAGLREVKGLQGEGALTVQESTFKVLGTGQTWWIGSLQMRYEANLTGPSTLEVRNALEWKFQSTMSGSGTTVLGPSSVNTFGNANSNFTIANRRVVNEGTIVQVNYGTLHPTEGGVFENLGTYTLNGEDSLWQIAAEGAGSAFVNRGTFQKTAGTGNARLLIAFENLGTIRAASGAIRFEHSGTSFVSADGSNIEGPVVFEDKASVTLGAMTAPGAELSLRESQLTVPAGKTAAIGSLGVKYLGNVTGAGTLEVRGSLAWEGEATMSGTGRTILGPAAVSTIGSANVPFSLAGRTLVNEGTLTQHDYSTLVPKEGAVFENLGTYNVNGESSRWQIQTEGAGSAFVNKGVFRKTAGTGRAKIHANFENLGTIRTTSGTICFEESGSSLVSGDGSNLEGPVAVESKASLTLGTMAAPGANLTIKGSQLTVPYGKTASLGSLTMEYEGTVTGAGTLKISKSLSWVGPSTMENIGSTVIAPSATATVTSTSARLLRRTLVNEGTLTLEEQGQIIASEGATLENDATLKPNSVPSYGHSPGITTGLGLVAPKVVNNGTIRKTAGTGETRLAISLENKGTIDAETGLLLYDEPGAIVTLKPGSVLKGTNRFKGSGLAGEGFSAPSGTLSARESTILLEGENTKIANLKVDYGTLIGGAGHVEVTEALLWEGQSSFSGTGRLTLGPATKNVLDGGGTTETLSGWFLVNEGTFTRKSGALNMNGGAVLENKGTFKLNAEPYPTWKPRLIDHEGGGTAAIVNEGEFLRNEGAINVNVVPDFENLGVVKGVSSEIEILHPKQLSAAEKAGCATAGDPVNCATGNFSESQTDFAIGGRGIGLDLTRDYSSQGAVAATSPGPFGYGWSGSFTDHLAIEESGAKVTLTRGSGQTTPFTRVSGTTYAAPAWSRETLSGSPEAGYTFTALDQTRYRFSGGGRLEAVTDRNGNETTLGYDEAGRLKTVTDPAGRQLTLAYNAGGQVETATDPIGHVVKYAYESGNLTSVTMPGEASPRWQFKYDGSHRITQVTGGRGGKTTNEYDSEGRVVSQTDPAGRTITFKYQGFHTTITNKATGEVTDEWFTSYNEPFQVTHGYGTPQATTRTFAYNQAGQLTATTDGNGHTTSYGYDEAGNRTSERDPLGHETKWTFNSAHEVTSTTTPGGETTTIKRDANGNVESVSRPAPGGETQTLSFEHGSHGELKSLTNPLGKTWSFSYDGYGDPISETDPLGDRRTLSYDKDSRLTAIVSPRGNVEGAKPSEYETKVERDPQGRPVKVTDPLGHASEYAYDANGNLGSLTDANGHTTKFTYNADDERTKVERPTGATLETGYDGAGFLTSQTDGNGKTTTYVRNVLEQPVEVIDPLGRKTGESFDAAGNLTKQTDPSGRETTYSYDSAGRLTEVSYSEAGMPAARFGYDAEGKVTTLSDGSGESTFAYDQLGRLTRSEDGNGDVVSYGYDLANQQTSIVYPNGKSVSRSYDGAGRLESIGDWLGGKTSFAYDAESNLLGIGFPASSGNVDEYAYDRAARISEAKFKKGSETLASLTYTHDALGQVEEEARHGLPGAEKVSYGYDQSNRLTKAGGASFEYDAANNLTAGMGSANAYDAAGQLERGTGATYSYDKEGERSSETKRVAEAPEFLRAFGGTGSGAGNLSAPAATATDKEGNVWVADTSHNRLQEFNGKGEFVRQVGAFGTESGQFNAPRGLAINQSSGNIYVADSKNNRIQELGSKGEFIRAWGSSGEGGAGKFLEPTGLALDPEGHVWTVETGATAIGTFATPHVQEFSSEGTYLAQFGAKGTEAGKLEKPQGIAVSSAGNVYVADTANNRVEEFKPSGELIRAFGKEGTGNGELKKPAGLGFDPEGSLWVADTGNNRLQRFSAEGTYLSQFGTAGNNNGQLSEPKGLAVDSSGNVWVADTNNNRVQEFSATEFLRKLGGTGSEAGNLSAPAATATDKEGNVWVADTGHNRIQEFSPKGEFLRQFGAFGSENGQFNAPRGLALDSSGNVYVADSKNNRIQEFTAKGEFLRKWGTSGEGGAGKFAEPTGVALDPEGHVWTVETGTFLGTAITPHIQKFSATGTYLSQFGAKGSEPGQLSKPQGIAVSAAGNIYVADTNNNRLQEFKPAGELIRVIGKQGSGNGEFRKPAGLGFDPEGKLWVADTENNRLQRLSAEGEYLSQFGIAGSESGQLSEPKGLAVDSSGNLWVADTANNRVQEFSATEFLRAFGGTGSSAGNLSAPAATATDKEGNVWVADTSHNRLQEFNGKGEFVRQVGAFGEASGQFKEPRGIAISPAGNLYVADSKNNRIEELGSKGEFIRSWGSAGEGGAGKFAEPTGVAIDPEGHVWTVETGTFLGTALTPHIQKFSSEGTYLAQFGTKGSEAGQLSKPQGIAVSTAGNIYVADTNNNRVQEFKPSGELIRAFGKEGSGNGEFKKPAGLAFDSEGALWVADTANNRLQRLSATGTYLAQLGAAGNEGGQLSEPKGLALDGSGNLWVADTANNRVQELAWASATTTYAYDQAGELTGVHRPAAGSLPALNETLAYDATGLLASKTAGSTTRYLAWDASSPLPLLLSDGESSYLYGPGGLPVEQVNAKAEPTYLHHDQLGSTRLLTGASGTATASLTYAPYGALEAKTGTATTPLGFAAQYTDAESGLQYLRARFYDPSTGQFLSRDPLAAITREPFGYAANNPLLFKDPSGLDFAEELGGTGLPCLFCEAAHGAQELLEPPLEEAENAASWVLSHSLGAEELDEGEFESPEPCLEPPVDPWEREKRLGDRGQQRTRDAQFADKLRHPTDPENPRPGGSGPEKAIKVLALVSKLLESFHRP